MKTIRRLALVLGLLAGISLVTGSPAHAARSNAAWCNTGANIYIHGPVDGAHNGTLWSYATVVPTSTVASGSQDRILSGHYYDIHGNLITTGCQDWSIDEVSLWVYTGGSWQQYGINYESAHFINTWGDTVIATVGWCDPNADYYTKVSVWLGTSGGHYTFITAPWSPC